MAVVLLEDLVEAGEVEVDVLLQLEEVLGRLLDLLLYLFADAVSVERDRAESLADLLDLHLVE